MKEKLIIILMIILIAVMGFMCYMIWNMNNNIENLKSSIITKSDLKNIEIEQSGNGGVVPVNGYPRYTVTLYEK